MMDFWFLLLTKAAVLRYEGGRFSGGASWATPFADAPLGVSAYALDPPEVATFSTTDSSYSKSKVKILLSSNVFIL